MPASVERLDGLRIGILDIVKPRGDVFLHRQGERLTERRHCRQGYAKATNTRVAPLPLRQQIAGEVDLVIEGLSDWGFSISSCTHDVADQGRSIPTVGVATTESIEVAAQS